MLLSVALIQLFDRDRKLLELGASERSVIHRLGHHLQDLVPEWDVDCEYNRVGNLNQKKQPRDELCDWLNTRDGSAQRKHLNKAKKKLHCKDLRKVVEEDVERRTFPDLIVHKRSCEHHNLLVIEAKTSATDEWQELVDFGKLICFTKTEQRKSANKKFFYPRYRFGVFLAFDGVSLSKAWLFRDGVSQELNPKRLEPV